MYRKVVAIFVLVLLLSSCGKKEGVSREDIIEERGMINNSLDTEKESDCGNGVCEEGEVISGTCPEDCGSSADSEDNFLEELCGNGVCEEKELIEKTCSEDCGGEDMNSGNDDLNNEIMEKDYPTEVCGNGVCEEKELIGGNCPPDCG